MLKITQVNFADDGITALYIDGKQEIWGDWYHNKIDEVIEGFLRGLRYGNVEYELEKFRLISEEEVYDAPKEWPDGKYSVMVEKE